MMNPMRIAVIGSGIAGLTAVWVLGREHRVTLFERHPILGMDAHGIDIDHDGVQARVDVPLRVFYEGYYQTLLKVYRAVGIEIEKVNYASSFSKIDQRPYFRFDNLLMGPVSFPFMSGLTSLQRPSLRILRDLCRFYLEAPLALKSGSLRGMTIEMFMKDRGYSHDFAVDFLYTAYAGICTCSLEAVRAYPAEIIIDYMTKGVLFTGVRRVKLGSRQVVSRLAEKAAEVCCGRNVQGVRREGERVVVTCEGEEARFFDHVVFATQANQIAKILQHMTEDERETLDRFAYEQSEVVMHTDPALCTPNQRDWSPVNFVTRKGEVSPMATIWMNRVQPELRDTAPIFQTWNPLVEAREETVLSRSSFERPVVSAENEIGWRELMRIHDQPGRRVWFCGSYAGFGIPLLESAAQSAVVVARRLGVLPPWESR